MPCCDLVTPLGRARPIACHSANGRYRRISPVAAHSGDRLLSEPTAGTQPCRWEPLFMPRTGHSRRQGRTDAPSGNRPFSVGCGGPSKRSCLVIKVGGSNIRFSYRGAHSKSCSHRPTVEPGEKKPPRGVGHNFRGLMRFSSPCRPFRPAAQVAHPWAQASRRRLPRS
jgi:hypothetical protein